MGKAARVSLLILLLACPVWGGEMPNGVPAPPPPGPSMMMSAEEPISGEDMPFNATDTLTGAALSILNNVLALL